MQLEGARPSEALFPFETMMHTTLDHWIQQEAIPLSVDSSETFNAAIDKVIASLGVLTLQSFTDFDWLAVLDSTAYNRRGPPLQQPDASTQ